MLEYILDFGTVVPSYHYSLIIFLLLLSFFYHLEGSTSSTNDLRTECALKALMLGFYSLASREVLQRELEYNTP